MAILSENMVYSKTRTQDLRSVKQLNCWGSDLTDVSIVRQMPNVQVLSLSVNSISNLADFATCKNLVELYLRENRIKDLNQLAHLQELAHLRKLWLAGNPCAEIPNYRMTVLKALPNLEMLDNVPVTQEEVDRAEDSGNDLNSPGSCPSPERRNSTPQNQQQQPTPPQRQTPQFQSQPPYQTFKEDEDDDDSEEYEYNGSGHTNGGGNNHNYSQQQDSPNSPASSPLGNGHQAAQRQNSQQRPSYPEAHWNGGSPQQSTRSPPAHLSGLPLPNSGAMVRAASINDYAMFNGSNSNSATQLNNLASAAAHATNNGHHEQNSYKDSTPTSSSGGTHATNGGNGTCKPSYQRMLPKGGKHRNANILSAVLCLIKELDFASLEVVDTEIHCRMEEMGN